MPTKSKAPKKVTAKTPKSKGGPDWNAGRSMGYTGNCYLPPSDERIYRFPNEHSVRRDVDVEVTSWAGVSIGASHYYARIKLEQNQVWDSKGLSWFVPEHDFKCKAFTYSADVPTRAEAVEFVRIVLHTFFADQKVYRWTVRHGLYDEDGKEVESWEYIKKDLER